MIIKSAICRISSLLLLALLLCQCTPVANSPEPHVPRAIPINNPYTLPTAVYLAMAKNQQGVEQQSTLLLAAGRLIAENHWQQAQDILAQTGELDAIQQSEKNILLAQLALLKGQTKTALSALEQVNSTKELGSYQKIQYHQSLAQAYSKSGNTAGSIAERIKLDALALDTSAKQKNRRALWLSLVNLPAEERNIQTIEAAADSELAGWLELATIADKYRADNKALLEALDSWQEHHREHPANRMLPKPLDSIATKLATQPTQVALLLPLTGALAGPGSAVKDGFIAAKKAQGAPTKLKMYDTNTQDVVALYQQAISEGAEYVVGPLTKQQVAEIAAIDHPVPTLLLNDGAAVNKTNTYFFGLSATHEAVQVALNAHNKGHGRALIIAPKSAWGDEVVAAFSDIWQQQGAQVVAHLAYSTSDDLNKQVRALLQINQSEGREKQIKQLLGHSVETLAGRRQDFDMIFLLAYPSKARQIMPLLRYYYAADVPVFATSIVYSGHANPLKDKDLDGLLFCDIPWVFDHQMAVKNWPEQFNSYNRLYALGQDSFALTTQLNRLMLFAADGSSGAGSLYLKSTGQVARVLEWGRFHDGLAQSLGVAV